MTGAIVVRSPYDGHEIGRVPRQSPADVDRFVARASHALEERLVVIRP